MEEKLKDVYENIKDRLSNPLIFSFLVSWLIYNWEITVALVWYDKSQIVSEGCKSIFEFIEYKLDTKCCNTIFPVIAAIIYTLGFPYLKYLISILNSKALEWGKKNEIRYIREVTSNDILNLKSKVNDIQQKLDTSQNFIQSLYNVRILDGNWKFKVEIDNTGEFDMTEIKFSGKDGYLVSDFDYQEKLFEIENFCYDINMGKLFFIKKMAQEHRGNDETLEDWYKINDLKFKDKDTFVGEENGFIVEYKRVL